MTLVFVLRNHVERTVCDCCVIVSCEKLYAQSKARRHNCNTSKWLYSRSTEYYVIYVTGTVYAVPVVLLVHFNTIAIRVYLYI